MNLLQWIWTALSSGSGATATPVRLLSILGRQTAPAIQGRDDHAQSISGVDRHAQSIQGSDL